MMSYPCIYNEEGKCKLYSTVYERSWCVEGPCDDQTLSNGDRIRAMSDEELAAFLDEFSGRCMDCFSADCPIHKVGRYCLPQDIMYWLKQPCEVEI